MFVKLFRISCFFVFITVVIMQECPIKSEDGRDKLTCPKEDHKGRIHCIDDHVLCDKCVDCPNGEDEDGPACMFYKATKAHLDIIADAILKLTTGH